MAKVIEAKLQSDQGMPCGHPRGCLVQAEDGTSHCAWCEEVARLREALAKQIHKRQADVAAVLYARSETENLVFKWNEECGEELARLREELKRAASAREAIWSVPVKIHGVPCDKCGGTDYQCAECLENIAEIGSAVSKIEYECQAEVRRLREELLLATAREAALVEAANALVQRLAAVNLHASGATALGNALAYGPEVTALQDVLEGKKADVDES